MSEDLPASPPPQSRNFFPRRRIPHRATAPTPDLRKPADRAVPGRSPAAVHSLRPHNPIGEDQPARSNDARHYFSRPGRELLRPGGGLLHTAPPIPADFPGAAAPPDAWDRALPSAKTMWPLPLDGPVATRRVPAARTHRPASDR